MAQVATQQPYLRLEVAIGRAGPKPGWAKIGLVFSGQNFNSPPPLKTGPVGPNSLFKAKNNSGGPGQIWPGFFRANNLMDQPGPNFRRTGLAYRAGQILPALPPTPLVTIHFSVLRYTLLSHQPPQSQYTNVYCNTTPSAARLLCHNTTVVS